MKKEDIKKEVRKGYGKIAKEGSSCCSDGCGCGADVSKSVGYSDKDMESVPEGANLGLGCGNPTALACLKEGETVLDLGSGAGFDCFLAAKKVGPKGKVIGVDMTPEMLERARKNAVIGGYKNVEFLEGEIEALPLKDETVDVVISNCVINLSPDKEQVFREIYRVLKKGGRFMISDIVLEKPLPKKLSDSIGAYIGCIAGAVVKDGYLDAIRKAGFSDLLIVDESQFSLDYFVDTPERKGALKSMEIPIGELRKAADSIVSMKVSARKGF
jgi:arsenite methyltransferase